MTAIDRLRGRIGAAIFERVAGPDGPTRRDRINQPGGERWFAADRPIRRVHGDSWGRLQRTSYFLGVTTFGQAADARAAIRQVEAIHQHVIGIAPDGRPY